MSATAIRPADAASARSEEDLARFRRSPDEVMRLDRLGSFFQTRVSFVRTLLRRMARERWRVTTALKALDTEGFGRLVYEIETPQGLLSFAAFSNYLAPEERTDRVIAEKWDAAFTLARGRLGATALDRLAANAPRQEAGRFTADDLILSRANKSVRLFDMVVGELARGRQPDLATCVGVGYLMRTTAVYGNGKFGIADFDRLRRDGIFALPFQAEMLTVYLARQFSFDLAEHVARTRGGSAAVALSSETKRALGVGNATGLGMAPFLVGHPKLLNAWISARENALAAVRAVERPAPDRIAFLPTLIERARRHVQQWSTEDARGTARIALLREELADLAGRLAEGDFLPPDHPWDFLMRWASTTLSTEGSELVASLLIEIHPERADRFETTTGAPDREDTDPAMTVGALKSLIERQYGWAIARTYADERARHFFWYRSAEKEEPRLGERFNEPGAEWEMPIGFGALVKQLYEALASLPAAEPGKSTALFLLENPRWRGIVRRVQSLAGLPYAEIRDNLIGAGCLPIDLLRCKLSIFGAAKFDPKSDRWTRITLFQGAPLPDELDRAGADDWAFPAFDI